MQAITTFLGYFGAVAGQEHEDCVTTFGCTIKLKNVFEIAKAKQTHRIGLLDVRLGLPDWKCLPMHNTFSSPNQRSELLYTHYALKLWQYLKIAEHMVFTCMVNLLYVA